MTPRILLVEDDPASRAFLAAAAATLPARVTEAAGCAQAQALAAGEAFDLWLLDAQLGDGDGATLLAELRARYPDTPALAHTAANDAQVFEDLRAAGFDAVVAKPLSAAALREALRRLLGERCGDWDEAGALEALNGNAGHVQGLRRLFLSELPAQAEAVTRSLGAGDVAGAAAVLHRLRASCGFVGAARLGDAVLLLEAAPTDTAALARFQAAVRALL